MSHSKSFIYELGFEITMTERSIMSVGLECSRRMNESILNHGDSAHFDGQGKSIAAPGRYIETAMTFADTHNVFC